MQTITLTKVVKLYPNNKNKKRLDFYMKQRDIYWNKCLSLWNNLYQTHTIYDHIKKIVFSPQIICNGKNKGKFKVDKKGKLVIKAKVYHLNPNPSANLLERLIEQDKSNFDYLVPAHMIRLTIKDLDYSFHAFFNTKQTDANYPKFKDLNKITGSYKDDCASIKNGKLRLATGSFDNNKYPDIRTRPKLPDQKLATSVICRKDNGYFLMFPVKVPVKQLMSTGLDDGVDVNVGHFNSTGVCLNILPDHLQKLYQRTKHYQRMLAIKRNKSDLNKNHKSNRYLAIREHLKRDHRKITNIQHNIVQKYTTYLVKYHDNIYIEDLDVKHMLMSHVASKGIHRSLFGYFRQVLTYKCKEYNRNLIVVDRFYPSTQMCPNCGAIKTGDDKITLKGNKKHQTKHNEFKCYQCGYTADRDEKVVPTLMRYTKLMMKHIKKEQHKKATIMNGFD